MNIKYPFSIDLGDRKVSILLNTTASASSVAQEILYTPFDIPRYFPMEIPMETFFMNFMQTSKEFVGRFNLKSIYESINNAKYTLEGLEKIEKPTLQTYQAARPLQKEDLLPEPIQPIKPIKPSAFVEPIKPSTCVAHPEKPDTAPLVKAVTFLKEIAPFLIHKSLHGVIRKWENNLNLWKKECAQIDADTAQWGKAKREYKEQYLNWRNDVDVWCINNVEWKAEHKIWETKQKELRLIQEKAAQACLAYKEYCEFEKSRNKDEEKCRHLIGNYLANRKEGILDFCALIINRSPFPELISKKFKLHYDESTKLLLVEFQLPNFDGLEITTKKTEKKKFQEFILFGLPIRIMWELAKLDKQNTINSIAFNGWIDFTDKSTGKSRNACILSVHATKEQLTDLIIEKVDPKECFRSLKGVAANKLTEYIPIAPILMLDKNDKRLIAGKDILSDLNKDENLAAMDWEDFEHLIRELFEKEFANSGAEVRVTQANRDRGVDAIIYDPDPIRGGKFVIQAKRYTAPVDVSAIRDLYGTVLNEGASRGIIVTTSSYGGDSYAFAKNKPITLLDGGNLLHLFQKHGYNFKINLKEAKIFAATNNVGKKTPPH